MNKHLVKTVFIRTIPIMTGYIVLGIGFGVLLQKAGYSWIWALVMSLAIYSGTMQYVAVDLLSSGASVITVAIMAVVVNIRYMFYGIPLMERYRDSGWKKFFLIFGLTDENFALLCNTRPPLGSDDKWYCFLVTVFDQIYWIIGSVIGVLLGSVTKFNTAGIEFVMTALFVTIFVDQWRLAKNHIPAIIGVGTALICLLIFNEQNFLIPTMILTTLALSFARPFIEPQERADGAEDTSGPDEKVKGGGVS